MKKYFLTLLIVGFGITSLSVQAQKAMKIGHINSQELLASMPESDSAQKKLEKIAKEHQGILEEMNVELNKKYEAYRTVSNTLSELAKATKEAEMEDLQTRIQTFEQTAQQDIQQKRTELFQPVQNKALKAVKEVAEENGFTYILDSGAGVVVYEGPDAQDILPLVKKKLGLQ
jgi:outer membrane protein